MAQLLLPFLPSTNLFFSITNDFKSKLFDEFWSCQAYIGLDMTLIKSMPVYERKYQIARHNDKTKKENEERTAALNKTKNKR